MRKNILQFLTSGVWITFFLSVIIFCVVYQIWNIDLNIPSFCGHGDGISTFTDLRNFLDGGFMFSYENMAAPYGCEAVGRSTDGLLNYGILYFLVRLTRNPGLSLNLFYIMTYPLTAVIGYIVLKKFNIQKEIAIVGGILYSFLPYHYLRTMHLNLFTYFMVPLSLMGMIFLISSRQRIKRDEWILIILGNILLGIESLYYAAFGMILYGFIIIYNLLKRRLRHAIFSLINLCCIAIPCIITLLMPYFKGAIMGGNLAEISRLPVEVNIYGLRVWSLLLPILGHRLEFINSYVENVYSELMDKYYDIHTMSLGLIMSIGFVGSFLTFIIGKKKDDTLVACGKLNCCMLLLTIVNGLDVLIAVFVSTSIRCYNRISVFIAFVSVMTVCIFLRELLKNRKRSIIIFCCIFLLIIGIYDQTPSWLSKYVRINETKEHVLMETFEEYETDYRAQSDFWNFIEEQLDDESIVFTMPFVAGEEYSWGYRMTRKIRWNYNYSDWMATDEYSNWMAHLDNLPLEQQIDELIESGVSGIVVLKEEYEDEDFLKLKNELNQLTGEEAVTNNDNSLAFWKLGQ